MHDYFWGLRRITTSLVVSIGVTSIHKKNVGERPHRKVKLTFSISSCGTKHIPYSNMVDTTYCPRQTCVFLSDRFVQLYQFHFGLCKCTPLNSNWVVLIRKSCGSTYSQIKKPTSIEASRAANHHTYIQKH